MTCSNSWKHLVGFAPSIVLTAVIAPSTVLTPPAAAQETHGHEQEAAHHVGLHFSHPLVTESVSPDTKLRLNVAEVWGSDANESEVELEAEYAFHRSFSVELSAPYAVVDPEGGASASALSNIEVALKFGNFAFEDHGLLLGYGVEFGLPTGSAAEGIGSEHLWEVAPFLNLGYRRDRIELVSFSIFGIPFNQDVDEEVETEFSYDLSGLVHLAPQLQAMMELNGKTVLSGAGAGGNQTRLSPGLKIAPSGRVPLFVGVGMTVPLTGHELDVAARVSLFYHF